ncbi:LysR substrate-binding domain-containing protein [Cupriavidus sp. AU9028]|uniref:LysR substrate-binding domain-containing protein n=1 Tax=Cupriavidus sp. AU9028 TaxID=2871157 RepID=UPI001C95C926|nr:LysR substrate-binding domain-containing protein [Cupriavidus sp. AU9028]MBY4898547.1 LysR family transcriptional regulator [Cupriavidus sp. AU9028]
MTPNRPDIAAALRALSLDALRGFDSAARHLSFTAAADELYLTQSAVSKQVKSLEDALGTALFRRGGKGLALTQEGRLLLQATRTALDALGDAVGTIVTPPRAALAVTTTPSFASLWLVPRLTRLQRYAPEIDVRIDASEAMASLERDGYDLAIRLRMPGQLEEKPLLRERLMLVAAPEVAARLRQPEDLQRVPLLVFHDPGTRFGWMSWTQWYARLGLQPMPDQPCLYFSRYDHVVEAALQGAGIAIGRAPLILPALAQGRLAVVFPDHAADGLEYELVVTGNPRTRAVAMRFRDWLLMELAADVTG